MPYESTRMSLLYGEATAPGEDGSNRAFLYADDGLTPEQFDGAGFWTGAEPVEGDMVVLLSNGRYTVHLMTSDTQSTYLTAVYSPSSQALWDALRIMVAMIPVLAPPEAS